MGTVAAELLDELTRLGIELAAHGDRLRYRARSAVTPDMLGQLKTHKAPLLAILGSAGRPSGAMGAGPEATRWEDCFDVAPPCANCGDLGSWWNPLGGSAVCHV